MTSIFAPLTNPVDSTGLAAPVVVCCLRGVVLDILQSQALERLVRLLNDISLEDNCAVLLGKAYFLEGDSVIIHKHYVRHANLVFLAHGFVLWILDMNDVVFYSLYRSNDGYLSTVE